MTERTPEQLRREAAEAEEKKEESFRRCDTDGFLSQWAHGLMAEKKRREADLLEQGNKDEFPALFDLDGNRVRAKLIQGKCGMCWAFCNASGRFTGKFISAFPKREGTMAKKGFKEGKEIAPAKVVIKGRGHGLSGSAWVATVRTDKGYPETVK